MYLPRRFQNEKRDDILELMRKFPLATVISVDGAAPFISHLPLIVDENSENFVLAGHMARANPHWRLLKDSKVTVIFNGPNAYITPKWYAENDVPTWNYAVVHATGTAELIETFDGISSCLKLLTMQIERDSPAPWEFWIPDDLSTESDLCSAIVGFRITLGEVKAKFKLSQNRSEDDRLGVLRGLEERPDDMSRGILNLMKKDLLTE